MEPDKERNKDPYEKADKVNDDDAPIFDKFRVIFYHFFILFESPLHCFVKIKSQRSQNVDHHDLDVNEKQEEKLPVIKSNTIIYPKTVMVHIQHTSIAGRTMVAPFGLETITHYAEFSFYQVAVALVIAPVGGHSPRIDTSRHQKRPYHH